MPPRLPLLLAARCVQSRECARRPAKRSARPRANSQLERPPLPYPPALAALQSGLADCVKLVDAHWSWGECAQSSRLTAALCAACGRMARTAVAGRSVGLREMLVCCCCCLACTVPLPLTC